MRERLADGFSSTFVDAIRLLRSNFSPLSVHKSGCPCTWMENESQQIPDLYHAKPQRCMGNYTPAPRASGLRIIPRAK